MKNPSETKSPVPPAPSVVSQPAATVTPSLEVTSAPLVALSQPLADALPLTPTRHQPSAADNRKAILCVLGAMACFIINDSMIKLASQQMGSGQTIFLRAMAGAFLVLVILQRQSALGNILPHLRGWVLVRAVVDGSANVMFLWALFRLPLANASAINLAIPLFMTAMGVFIMREYVSRAQWSIIALGFIGVVCVIQPSGDGFNAYAWLALFSTAMHAVRDLLVRKIAVSVPSFVLTLTTMISVGVIALVTSFFEGWKPITGSALLLLAGASVLIVSGYQMMTAALRIGDLGVIAPFRYSGLLWALLLGYVFWGQVPNTLAWLGIGLLVGSGLYTIYAQRPAK